MFQVIYNPTDFGEYTDKTIICEICKNPSSVVIIFGRRICLDCLDITRTCLLREIAKQAGLTHKQPSYNETPTQTFPIKTDKEIK